MDELSKESFRYTTDVAAGMRSAGERANHSQVSIWRDWHQTDDTQLAGLLAADELWEETIQLEIDHYEKRMAVAKTFKQGTQAYIIDEAILKEMT